MKLFARTLVGLFLIFSPVTADTGSFLGAHKKKISLLGTVAGHYLLTQVSPSYRKRSSDLMDQAKEAVVLKGIAPVLTKLEHVKHDGLSRQDVINTGIVAACTVGVGAHLQFHKLDRAGTTEVLSKDSAELKKHKLLVGGTVLAVAGILFAYLEGLKLPHMQQFLHSLSRRQKHAIDRCPHMQKLLDNIRDNPKALLEHDPLVDLLHDHQKELLDKAAQEHLLHNDPLSLLDGLD